MCLGSRSVKWVGLFGATALVGLYTIEDLWNKFGDLKMPKVSETACRTTVSVPIDQLTL